MTYGHRIVEWMRVIVQRSMIVVVAHHGVRKKMWQAQGQVLHLDTELGPVQAQSLNWILVGNVGCGGMVGEEKPKMHSVFQKMVC